MNNEDCLIIVPVFNESENIGKVIKDLRGYFKYILIIDDGSNDASFEIIESLEVLYIKHFINLGQGASIDTGLNYFLKNKKFNYAITFDGDGQNKAIDASNMLEYAKNNALSAVVGSRFKEKNNNIDDIPLIKKYILYLAILYEKLFFNINLTDAHNGLRVLKRDLVKDYIFPLKSFDMGHATEISYKICKSKYKFKEYPISVQYKNKRSQSPINAINIAIKNIFRPL